MRSARNALLAALAALSLSAAAADAKPRHSRQQHVQRGVASWYGQWHHGRTQANGKPFNMNARTVASRTIPLGRMVRITNLDNGRSVQAKVTDRGPYVGRRVLDGSKRIASDLGYQHVGLARVRVQWR